MSRQKHDLGQRKKRLAAARLATTPTTNGEALARTLVRQRLASPLILEVPQRHPTTQARTGHDRRSNR